MEREELKAALEAAEDPMGTKEFMIQWAQGMVESADRACRTDQMSLQTVMRQVGRSLEYNERAKARLADWMAGGAEGVIQQVRATGARIVRPGVWQKRVQRRVGQLQFVMDVQVTGGAGLPTARGGCVDPGTGYIIVGTDSQTHYYCGGNYRDFAPICMAGAEDEVKRHAAEWNILMMFDAADRAICHAPLPGGHYAVNPYYQGAVQCLRCWVYRIPRGHMRQALACHCGEAGRRGVIDPKLTKAIRTVADCGLPLNKPQEAVPLDRTTLVPCAAAGCVKSQPGTAECTGCGIPAARTRDSRCVRCTVVQAAEATGYRWDVTKPEPALALEVSK